MSRYSVAIVLGLVAIALSFAPAQASGLNHLALDVPGSVCMKPGSGIVVAMDVSNLQQPVSSCQAFLNFSSAYFLCGPSDVSIAPGGGGVWEELIWRQWNTAGDLDVAVGVELAGPVATSEDGTVARMTLRARPDVEGTTRMVFRPDASPDPGLAGSTLLGTVSGDSVWPTKSDSPDIVIDGTAPNITIVSASENGHEIIGTLLSVVVGAVNVQIAADDPVHGGVSSGLDGNPALTVKRGDGSLEDATFVSEEAPGIFNYTWNVTPSTPAGTATLNASVADRAGNVSHDSVSLAPSNLALNVPGAVYIKPGDNLLVDLDVSNLQRPVNACQAFLNFSSAYFLCGPSDVAIAPGGGGVWEELIWGSWNTGGDLDVAVGVRLEGPIATSANGTVAKMTLKARPGVDGATRVVFRPDADPDPGLTGSTLLSNVAGNPVWPTKSDSPTVIIDGTVPSIVISSIRQQGQEFLGTDSHIVAGTVYVMVDAEDPINGGVSSGLAGHPTLTIQRSDGSTEEATFVNEAPDGVFNYVWNVVSATPDGSATLTASVSDRSGNLSSDAVDIEVNTNTISGVISMDTLSSADYSFDRASTFKATDDYGALLKTWVVTVHFVNDPVKRIAAGGYVLVDVPQATGGLSAKTDWSVRRRQAVDLVDGEATIRFDGASRLLGGDLSTDNIVNVSDYNTLRTNWLRRVAASDINGDGIVNVLDYNIVMAYWFKVGDSL